MDHNPRRRAASFALFFLVFVALTVTFRVLLAAPSDQRATAALDSQFAVVWEAWRALERASGGSLLLSDQAAQGAILSMADAADVDVNALSQRIADSPLKPPSSVPQGFEDVWRAWRILQAENPAISPGSLARAAISALAGEVHDPILQYLSTEDYQSARTFFGEDSYTGIGAYVDNGESGTVIVKLYIGGPAEAAGLRPGDRILSVDGQSALGMMADQVVELIRGPEGTEVTIEVQGIGDSSPRTVRAMRQTLHGESLFSDIFEDQIGDERIGYIQLERFHRTTGQQFRDALSALIDRDIEGLILDMRGNPGGSLLAASEVASQFLTDGVVMYEEDVAGKREPWKVIPGGQAPLVPLVVLVDGGSASAAEVVAGALQDHGRAVIYGMRTYGKGSVQTFQELSDGSALYLTIAHWFTPDGSQIQDEGIMPDVEVRFTRADILERFDRQFAVAYTDLYQSIQGGRQ